MKSVTAAVLLLSLLPVGVRAQAKPSVDDAIAAIAAFAPRALAEQGAPGMTVAITDRTHTVKILTFGYANLEGKVPVTEQTRFPVGSLSKSMTSLALLQLHDRGLVDLNAPVTRYLPWWKLGGGDAIAVHQLLSHTAGIPDDYTFEGSYGYEIALLREAHSVFPPGTKWEYSNDGYGIAGAISSAITGKPWQAGIESTVFAPIGMSRSSAYFTPEEMADVATGYIFRDSDLVATPPHPALMPTQALDFLDPAGSVISTPEDMAAYMRFYLNGGKTGAGTTLLKPATFAAMTTPDRLKNGKPAGAAAPEVAEWPDFYRQYGYGFAIFNTNGDHLIGHTGGISGYTTCMQMNLTRGFGVIAMSNLVEAPLHPCAIVKYAMSVLRAQTTSEPFPAPPAGPPIAPLKIDAAQYAGTYRERGTEVRVSNDAGVPHLVDNGSAYALDPRGDDIFWTDDPRFPIFYIAFSRNKAKQVVSIPMRAGKCNACGLTAVRSTGSIFRSEMRRFAYVANAVAARSGKLEKVASIAEYLRELDDPDLHAAARFFTGNPFAARDQRSLNLGGRTIVAVAKRVWGFDDAALSLRYRETGDLGSALGPLVRPASELMLFSSETLTPALLDGLFVQIADESGKHAGKKREAILERILRACTDPLEAAYVIKIITGDLRIGLREGLVHDAIAAAFESTHRDIHRAVMASGDVGEVAVAAKQRRLDEIHVAYGSPIGFMLASPVPYGEAYKELSGQTWIAEDKFDGIRAQAHVDNGIVTLYSRNFNDITHSYPDVAKALAMQKQRMILDGEIIASRDGRALPFRILQARLQRKEIDPSLLADVPLQYVVFDAIAIGDEFLIDEPLLERRSRLAEAFVPCPGAILASFERIEGDTAPGEINDRFESARMRGNEGLMLKRVDAPYVPGRRGKWWLKLKRELTTLDVVVVAVEWGHGKRAKVLSDYTFAVQDDEGNLLTIGKAYSGLTDAEIAELTTWFLAHTLEAKHETRRGRIPVEPQIVIEVAFDIVQRSDLHESGYALRFPRIVRIRDDKPVSQINTVGDVDQIYQEMLEREGIRHE